MAEVRFDLRTYIRGKDSVDQLQNRTHKAPRTFDTDFSFAGTVNLTEPPIRLDERNAPDFLPLFLLTLNMALI